MTDPNVHDDIRRATTLPGTFHTDPRNHEIVRDRVFARSWQYVADEADIRTPETALPLTLLPECLDEPIVLTRDANDRIHCLSNVCTHRGAIVAESPGRRSCLTCRYHGRRFELDGRFRSMPEFKETEDFPTSKDDLHRLEVETWRGFVFAAIEAPHPFSELVAEMDRRVRWMPVEEARHDPALSRDYLVKANWALYCDNYLEGFHIPFVHAALNDALDYGAYETETLPHGVLQLGVTRGGEDTFDIPAGEPDHGRDIGAYYYWLWPNVMFNFYPWGISLNIIRPLSHHLTRVSFRTYVWDESRLGTGAGAEIDRVEREDEEVVESVQRGLRSRFYDRGRFSPNREQGVHHFHHMLARAVRD
ncbi:MAG: aromatic ring-hydroxylating dioxygenase subunit alpha [Phycisphaerales bacterium]